MGECFCVGKIGVKEPSNQVIGENESKNADERWF